MDNIIQPPGDDGSIPRSKMPQVDERDLLSLLVYLGDKGLEISAGSTEPMAFKAHQLINIERAMAIPPEVLTKPAIVSKDYWIIDGDHRWYRHCVDKTKLPYIMIEASFEEAIKMIFSFPKTYEESIA